MAYVTCAIRCLKIVLCRAKARRFEVVEAPLYDDVAAEPVIKRPSRRRDAVGLSSDSVESTTARTCGKMEEGAVRAAAESLLRSRFEHEDFREGQLEAIVSVVDKNNPNVGVLSHMGTGQGKVRHSSRAGPGGIRFVRLNGLLPRLESLTDVTSLPHLMSPCCLWFADRCSRDCSVAAAQSWAVADRAADATEQHRSAARQDFPGRWTGVRRSFRIVD